MRFGRLKALSRNYPKEIAMGWPVRMVRLASSPQDGGLWCGPEGLTLAGHPLLDGAGTGFTPKSLPELQDIFSKVYGGTSGHDVEAYMPGLAGVARSLSNSDLPLAMIGSVMLKLPDIPDPSRKSSQEDGTDSKQAFDPAQSRDENGRWTGDSAGEARQASPIDFETDKSPPSTTPETDIAVSTERMSLEAITPEAIALLGRFAAAIAGPVALGAGFSYPQTAPTFIQEKFLALRG